MKFLVKNAVGRTMLATFDEAKALERLAVNPSYKLVCVPEAR